MTLHQLRVFDAVARHLSFTKASRELRISQPSVFQQVKILQNNCGKILYVKRGRNIALTADGGRFAREARKIVEGMEVLESGYGNPKYAASSAPLVVGGSHALSAWALPMLIARYRRANPEVPISFRIKSSSVVERLVLESEIDIALITHDPTSPLLKPEVFRRENMVIVVSRHHSLAQKKELTVSEFAAGPLIIRERKKSSSRALLDQVVQRGLRPEIAMICDSATAVKNAALAGLGIGIIFQDHVTHEIKSGELRKLSVKGLTTGGFDSYIIYHAQRQLSVAAQRFLDLLHQSQRHPRLQLPRVQSPSGLSRVGPSRLIHSRIDHSLKSVV